MKTINRMVVTLIPRQWPRNRNYKTFLKWFRVVPSDAVLEMGKGLVRIEDF